MASPSTRTPTSVSSVAGSLVRGSCCTKSEPASACRQASSSSTPSTRIGVVVRHARRVLAGAAVCAWRGDDTRMTSAAAGRPLVSPLSTPADYTVRVLPANASYAQIAVTARSVRAHVRLPLDEGDLVLRLDP